MTHRKLIVEADGGSRGNPGPAAYGALVRDPETREILVEDAAYLGETTNNVAEYSGLVAGLHAAKAIDPTARVEVRMDSKLVVEQMSGRWKIKHEDMRRLALSARAILPRDQITYVWVPRAMNSAADRLANAAMDAAAKGQTWRPEPLPYAGEAVGPAEIAQPSWSADELSWSADDPSWSADDPSWSADEENSELMSESTSTQAPPRLAYRLLTGTDDREFCAKVSAALADGYQLHGSPAISGEPGHPVVAQAVVDPRMLGFGS